MTTYDIHTAAAELDISTEDLMFLLKFETIQQQLCLFRKDSPRFTRFTIHHIHKIERYLVLWRTAVLYNLKHNVFKADTLGL